MGVARQLAWSLCSQSPHDKAVVARCAQLRVASTAPFSRCLSKEGIPLERQVRGLPRLPTWRRKAAGSEGVFGCVLAQRERPQSKLAGHARWGPVLCGDHRLEARHQRVNLDGFWQIVGRAQTPRLLFRFLSITDRDHDHGNIAQQEVAL